jgi:hypothetical protein
MIVAGLFMAPPAQASLDVYDATTTPPMVTVVMSRSEITAADDMLGKEPTGPCTADYRNIVPLPGVLKWIATNTPKVQLTGSVETAVTKDTSDWCAHQGESFGASWQQLRSFSSQYGMHFISHSANYPQNWTNVPSTWVDPYGGSDRLADWQNWETCGSRDAITAHGLLGADGQFNWPNSVTDPTVMANDVLACFYMQRSYSGTSYINTAASVEGNQNTDVTKALSGGHCNELNLPCSNPPGLACTTCRYTTPLSMINMINNLKPGQALNLQAYVLVAGTNPVYTTNQDQWDCTNPDPAYHWSNDAERYCFADFARVMQAIQNNPNVVVTDPEGEAQNWGMSPPTR